MTERRERSFCESVWKFSARQTGFHIPHRFSEGYGLNIEHLKIAKERGYSLVVTVDTGTRSFEPLTWAKENGLDVIVTDHHLSDEVKGNPECVAMVNPNQSGLRISRQKSRRRRCRLQTCPRAFARKRQRKYRQRFFKSRRHRHDRRRDEIDGRKSRDCFNRLDEICRKRTITG